MTAAGILSQDERIELIGGEIVPMSPKGNQHEILKTALNIYWARRFRTICCCHRDHLLADARHLSRTNFVFYPKASGIKGLTAATAKLVVEIADSSLGYDLGRKAGLYAGFGIAELWVIDAVRLATHIHRDPTPSGYGAVSNALPTSGSCR